MVVDASVIALYCELRKGLCMEAVQAKWGLAGLFTSPDVNPFENNPNLPSYEESVGQYKEEYANATEAEYEININTVSDLRAECEKVRKDLS